jgi:hypothetical protein
MLRYLLSFLVLTSTFIVGEGYGEIHGKVDFAPIFARVKVQESGQTVKTLDMGGARIDGTFLFIDGTGICLKPFIQAASGKGDLTSGGVGLGHYTPLTEKIAVLPSFGFTASHLQTRIDLPIAPGFVIKGQKERFRSIGFYLSLEACYKITPNLVLSGIYQYNWSKTHTVIGNLISQSAHCEGPNYALLLDYYFCENWSVNGAIAMNKSLSREKHGIVAYGAKLGIGYLF